MADGISHTISRRNALKCLAYGGAGTLFTLAGGVLTPFDLAVAGIPRPPFELAISSIRRLDAERG
jgi:hypothetical protein